MKGITLPVNMVVITAIVVLVLVVVVFFFTASSGKGITDVEARKIFFETCSQLDCGTPQDVCMEMFGQIPGHDAAFYDRFYKACNVLYGGDAGKSHVCFAACGNCVKLTDGQRDYIRNGRDNEGLVPDLDRILRRCSTVP